MKEFLEYIVKAIVKNQDQVQVVKLEMEDGDEGYQIGVASDDLGTVIGKSGRTIKNIKTLARIKNNKLGGRLRLEVGENSATN